jgi:cytochrome c peroxidase
MKPLVWLTCATAVALTLCAIPTLSAQAGWTDDELATLKTLNVDRLPPLDRSDPVLLDPRVARFGQALFFDERLSSNGEVSCATCHDPQKAFTDGEMLAEGVGMANRNTPTVIGSVYNTFHFWDGRADSLWAQALGPLEAAAEHGGTRTQYAKIIGSAYRGQYERLFGELPNFANAARFPDDASPVRNAEAWRKMRPADREVVVTVFVNMGKAIAAYERLLTPSASRFDTYIDALSSNTDPAALETLLDPEERSGLRLFIGKAGCTTCHSGPLLSDGGFHNTGVPRNPNLPSADQGRARGLLEWSQGEFTCQGAFGDGNSSACVALKPLMDQLFAAGATPGTVQFPVPPQSVGAFKTPSLRNVSLTAPYMHAGQINTLKRVLEHYNRAPKAVVGSSELKPLGLTATELDQLEAFLRALNSPPAVSSEWLTPPAR